MKLPELLFDDKFTDAQSWTLKQEDIVKAYEDARKEGTEPAFKVLFRKPIPEMRFLSKEWVIVPAEFMLELLEKLRCMTQK